ncbi:tRNA selenocysteine 1-associated protein 1-like [Tubulanus polymorphus]|uniref:tRNA selenocysteine 1-associated protein 1-like n=1 Tax=Tubulanus polymorphus TaxID=672921 RepID=UPI003DA1F438
MSYSSYSSHSSSSGQQPTKTFIPNTLWMGDLEPYMDEQFVVGAFLECGETVKSAKIIKNKFTGLPQGYCFVEFDDKEAARRAMLKLNGKMIPGTSSTKRFKLNHASYGKEHLLIPEFSLFVGDLSDEVDDLILYGSFRKYPSCHAAKVVLDQDGSSKGYGFVRFTDEMEQQRALLEMQHSLVGRKPIRVSLATPKRTTRPQQQPQQQQQQQSYDQSAYYQNYYQQQQQNQQNYYNSWQNYNNQQYYNYNQAGYDPYSQTQVADTTQEVEAEAYDDLEALEDPGQDIDIEKENEAYIEENDEFFKAMEESRWSGLDSLTTAIEVA